MSGRDGWKHWKRKSMLATEIGQFDAEGSSLKEQKSSRDNNKRILINAGKR